MTKYQEYINNANRIFIIDSNMNHGSWDGQDSTRDIFYDILLASTKLNSISIGLIGNRNTLMHLYEYNYDEDQLLPIWAKISVLFEDGGNFWDGPKFLKYDNELPDDITILVGRNDCIVVIETN